VDLQLAGRLAVVSGGSRGIGKACARALASEGATVVLAARAIDVARAAAAELSQECAATVVAHAVDTGDAASVEAMAAAVTAEFGAVDVLVNGAARPAGFLPPPALADLTDDHLRSELEVKVLGYLRTARAFAPAMIERGSGRIVNISGLAARQTGSVVGAVRNVGVVALTKTLAAELAPHGISAVCVHPGVTRTEATADALAARAAATGATIDRLEADLAARNLLGRMVTAAEVAQVVAFLASPRSVAINGDVIAVGGGEPSAIYY